MKCLLRIGAWFFCINLLVTVATPFNSIAGFCYQPEEAARPESLSSETSLFFPGNPGKRQEQAPVKEKPLSEQEKRELQRRQVNEEEEIQRRSAQEDLRRKKGQSKPPPVIVKKTEAPVPEKSSSERAVQTVPPPVPENPSPVGSARTVPPPTQEPKLDPPPATISYSEVNPGYLLALSMLVLVGLIAMYLMGKKIYGVIRKR
jgi:hypothetical protein